MLQKPDLYEQLETRADHLRSYLASQWGGYEAVDRLRTADEERALQELRGIDEHLAHHREEAARAYIPDQLSRSNKNMSEADYDLVYQGPKSARGQRHSWLRDLIKTSINDDPGGECRRRLAEHADQVRNHPVYNQPEYRDLSRLDGEGGYATPPAWLVDQYVELARAGRPFANLCQRQTLPGGTDSINIPKLLTGTTVGIQEADNTAISETDLTDTFISAPIRTIAGQQGISLQLLDQSPIAFEDVVARDLVAAHAAAIDTQVMSGTGTNGQVLGVDYTPGITNIEVSSLTIQGIYSAIANAIQKIHTTRFLPPEVIVMHPRRFGWLTSLLDGQDRPLVLPYANGPWNAAGLLGDVASQQVVGQIQGLPIVTSANVTTTAGSGTPTGDEDVIYVMRASDLLLWESGLRCRILPEVRANTLSVLVQVYGYAAFSAARMPQSVVTISGLTAPVW